MDTKVSMLIGAVCVVAAILLCFSSYVWQCVTSVFCGGFVLLVLGGGVLFIVMGIAQVREDEATRQKDEEDARRREQMAASDG